MNQQLKESLREEFTQWFSKMMSKPVSNSKYLKDGDLDVAGWWLDKFTEKLKQWEELQSQPAPSEIVIERPNGMSIGGAMNQSISEEWERLAEKYNLSLDNENYDDLEKAFHEVRTEERKELRKSIEAMLLPIPNPYGDWVSVENVNKKIIGRILALLEEK